MLEHIRTHQEGKEKMGMGRYKHRTHWQTLLLWLHVQYQLTLQTPHGSFASLHVTHLTHPPVGPGLILSLSLSRHIGR